MVCAMAIAAPELSPNPDPPPQPSAGLVEALLRLQKAAQLITSALDLDALLERVVNDVAESIGSVKVAVWLRDPDTDEMVLRGVRGRTEYPKGSRLKIGLEGMVGHVAATGQIRYAPDVRLDPCYIRCEPDTLCEVAVPLVNGGKVIGVISVDHTETEAFSEQERQVFQALASHISVAIENTHLFRRERAEREQIEAEIRDARAIQQGLLPKAIPLVPGFAFETAWHPAGALAGDWFDIIELGEDRYGIVLADVSGKGTPAALLMASTRAVLRSLVKLDPSPGITLSRLNQSLIEDFPCGKFVTMIYAVLDTRTRVVTLASAGHPRPMLINGDVKFLSLESGLPLGLGASSYPEFALHLQPGTGLLLYTDGITEATDRFEEEFGVDRLFRHFLNPDSCIDGLIEEVRRFGVDSRFSDDATALLIRSR